MKHEKHEPKHVKFSAEVSAAILRAATYSTGYAVTTGSEHAVKVKDGVVKVEQAHDEKGRETITVKVPGSFEFELTE